LVAFIGIVAVLAAVLGAFLGSRLDSDTSQSARLETTTTRTPFIRAEDQPGVGDNTTLDEWRVVVAEMEFNREPDAGVRLVTRVTLTNTSREPRRWAAAEQVALRFFVPDSSGRANTNLIRSPDNPTSGWFEVGPGATYEEEYRWSLPRGATNFLLGFDATSDEGEMQRILINLTCCDRS
jgi:hypothetical protein